LPCRGTGIVAMVAVFGLPGHPVLPLVDHLVQADTRCRCSSKYVGDADDPLTGLLDLVRFGPARALDQLSIFGSIFSEFVPSCT
jgi:hypothetical protein